MPDQFYYRNESDESVGPLPLQQIRKFVEAGVIPREVEVRKGDEGVWMSLESVLSTVDEGDEYIPVVTLVRRKKEMSSVQKKVTGYWTKVFGEPDKNTTDVLGCIGALVFIFVFLKIFGWIYKSIFSKGFLSGFEILPF